MPKLFCFSDCHGFFTELKQALDEARFEPGNSDHLLVGLGDYLDRGNQANEVIDYLLSVPNKVLIRGNHCDLFEKLCQRGYPLSHDWHNGTADTILSLASNTTDWSVACSVAIEKMKPLLDQMVNYFETDNYIFVHSFIPLKSLDGLPKYYTRNRQFEFNPDWRHAHASAWAEACWSNPFQLAKDGFLPDKTLVFGHYHTSWPRHKYEGQPEMGEGADFSIYYGDGYIGLDSCVAVSGRVNVLVIEDEFLEDNNDITGES